MSGAGQAARPSVGFEGYLVIIYGIYGILFVTGLLTLAIVGLGGSAVIADSRLHNMQMGSPYSLVLVAGLVFLCVAGFLVIRTAFFAGMRWPIMVLVVVAISAIVAIAILPAIKTQAGKKKQEETEIAIYARIVEKNPGNLAGHMSLASVYERYNRYLKAAQEYHVAADIYPERESAYVERLRDKEKRLRRLHAHEQEKKTFVCPRCRARNIPQQRVCSDCRGPLHGSTLKWAWKNTSNAAKIGTAATVAVSLLFLIWLPVAYCVALAAVWLSVIVCFLIPWERFTSV